MRVVIHNHLPAHRTNDGLASSLVSAIIPFLGKHAVGTTLHVAEEHMEDLAKGAVSAGLSYLGSAHVTEAAAAAVAGYIIGELVHRLGFTPENVSLMTVKIRNQLKEAARQDMPKTYGGKFPQFAQSFDSRNR